MVTPIVRSKYRHLYHFCFVKVLSINYNKNLLLLDDPGHVRSQIASIVCQIQRFDFDRNLVLTRKVIIVLKYEHVHLYVQNLYRSQKPDSVKDSSVNKIRRNQNVVRLHVILLVIKCSTTYRTSRQIMLKRNFLAFGPHRKVQYLPV
jgi:hypothetical protein